MGYYGQVFRYAAAICLVAVHGLSQSAIPAGDVEVVAPEGWSVTKQPGNGLLLRRTDKGNPSVINIGSEAFTGSLAEKVRQTMQAGFANMGLRLERLTEGKSANGHPTVSFNQTVRAKGQQLRICGIGFDLGGRLQLAWLATVDDGNADEREHEFDELVRTWRFRNGSANVQASPPQTQASPPPTQSAPELVGFYWGSDVRNEFNGLSGGLELKAVRNYIVLLPNGRAYRGIPPGGHVLDMDLAAQCRRYPLRCGTYSVQGDKITFEWTDRPGALKRKTSTLQGRGGSFRFEFDGTEVSRVPPLPDLRVNGRYTATTVIVGGSASSSMTASNQRTLALTPDGRYTKSGFSAVSFSNEAGGDRTGGGGRSRSGVESGSYSIRGFQLTLKPDSGPPEYFTIVIETPGTSPKALFIDDAAFLAR